MIIPIDFCHLDPGPKMERKTPLDEQLIAEIRRLNANIEALLTASQGKLLAQLMDILRDLREIAAGTLGYDISGDDA